MSSTADNPEDSDTRCNGAPEGTEEPAFGLQPLRSGGPIVDSSNEGGDSIRGRGQPSSMNYSRSRGYPTSELRRGTDGGGGGGRQRTSSTGGDRRADYDSGNVSGISGGGSGAWNRSNEGHHGMDGRGRHPSQGGGSGSGTGRDHGGRSRSRSIDSGGPRDGRYSYYTNYPEDNDGRRNSRDVAGRDRYYGDGNQDDRQPSSHGYQGAEGSASRGSSSIDRIRRPQSGIDRSRSQEERLSMNGTTNDDKDTDQAETDVSMTETQTKQVEWPPSFETDGSSFVFDARSAMFYECLSDFFYDPRSKLYYGNRKGAYFRHDKTKDPPFEEVQSTTTPEGGGGGGEGGLDQVIVTAAGKVAANGPTVPKIAINLKTKKKKTTKSSQERKPDERTTAAAPTAAPTVSISKTQKEQIANIQKWTGKQAELNEGASTAATAGTAGSTAVVPEMDLPGGQAAKVRTTAKGEPICAICKRKFPSIDKLRLHEKASDLHKRNVEALEEEKQRNSKRNAEEAKLNESATPVAGLISGDTGGNSDNTRTPQYQDRAQKRRQLHGPDSALAMTASRAIGLPSVVNGGEGESHGSSGLDETNVGHKMMQRMGYNDSGKDTTNDPLRREWDRIEAMAGRHGPRGSHYGPNNASS